MDDSIFFVHLFHTQTIFSLMKVSKEFEQNLLRKRVPLPLFLIATILLMIVSYMKFFSNEASANELSTIQSDNRSPSRVIHQIRLNMYEFTKPLILTDIKEDATEFSDLRVQILEYINDKTVSGDIQSAGIYIRKLNGSSPISINADQSFNPGSVAKISILMAYLKMAEKQPQLLNQSLTLSPSDYAPIHQEFPSQEIEFGKKYTIRELLYFMIDKSANSATALLTKNIDKEIFENLFVDLGLPEVSASNANYQMSASAVSRFLRVLYNSSYLTAENSEFALSLLSKSDFQEGLAKGLPKSIKMAHKFGEQGDAQFKQLHETGIVYLNGNAYVITVMTRGKDMKNLSNFIADISKMVYNRFNTNI